MTPSWRSLAWWRSLPDGCEIGTMDRFSRSELELSSPLSRFLADDPRLWPFGHPAVLTHTHGVRHAADPQDLIIALPATTGFGVMRWRRDHAVVNGDPCCPWLVSEAGWSSWPEPVAQQPVARLPWGHITVLLDRLNDNEVRQWYAAQDVQHGWSRAVLRHHIDNGRYLRASCRHFSSVDARTLTFSVCSAALDAGGGFVSPTDAAGTGTAVGATLASHQRTRPSLRRSARAAISLRRQEVGLGTARTMSRRK